MSMIDVERTISDFAERPFDVAEFPYLFLRSFGNKEITLKRLRNGDTNKSDFSGLHRSILQTNNDLYAIFSLFGTNKTQRQ
ncbi:hypothetical protein [Acetobacter sp.]|uniref:hypothetical protein n=1 Tax=Acetobacter sp. TaxID=440 RepID=UPI0039ED5B0E